MMNFHLIRQFPSFEASTLQFLNNQKTTWHIQTIAIPKK